MYYSKKQPTNLYRIKRIKLLTTIILCLISNYSHAIGFSLLSIADESDRDLTFGVWYPSNSKTKSQFGVELQQRLVTGPLSVASAPLIVLSHGYGGWLGGHADTALALAQAGFVVAAPSHTGNTFKDMSSPINKWLIDRPRHVTKIIDYLKNQWQYRDALEGNGVGVFGFSAGGQTVLSLIGAIPNLNRAGQHCSNQPTEFVCQQGMIQAMLDAKMNQLTSSSQWGGDKRIKAAVIAAPGFGIAYDKKALSGVNVKLQIWSALLDRRVPHNSNVQPMAEVLGDLSENHWVKLAGHFAFMLQSCTSKLKKFQPKTWAFLCVDEKGFDRQAFHTEMNSKIVRFFKQQLTVRI
jgi:predicted dienelactone hydrolase